MAFDRGDMKTNTSTMNDNEVTPTAFKAVENTVSGSSLSLLENRNRVVSIPYVSITSSNAVYAYTCVITP